MESSDLMVLESIAGQFGGVFDFPFHCPSWLALAVAFYQFQGKIITNYLNCLHTV
jgi:hypothetical protein